MAERSVADLEALFARASDAELAECLEEWLRPPVASLHNALNVLSAKTNARIFDLLSPERRKELLLAEGKPMPHLGYEWLARAIADHIRRNQLELLVWRLAQLPPDIELSEVPVPADLRERTQEDTYYAIWIVNDGRRTVIPIKAKTDEEALSVAAATAEARALLRGARDDDKTYTYYVERSLTLHSTSIIGPARARKKAGSGSLSPIQSEFERPRGTDTRGSKVAAGSQFKRQPTAVGQAGSGLHVSLPDRPENHPGLTAT